ncbi:hypothetical protein PLIIFM63780_005215 [Purpureocillium lilacinum]|nr:hypothetical protein PLIIFM63780_005215 [Purpureocillium lilacinum]
MTGSTGKTNGYDKNFEAHMAEWGIFLPCSSLLDGYVPPVPDNMDEIRERMARRRDSVPPSRISDADIEKFRSETYSAENEDAVKAQCLPYVEGDLTLDDSVFTEKETVFNNFKHLTDGSLVACQPDRWYGESCIPDVLRSAGDLAKHIVPSTQEGRPVVPNFFLEVKGPGGTLNAARRQACYDGALGARAIRNLQVAGQSTPPPLDNMAYTIAITLQNGHLELFTCHPVPPRGTKTAEGYVMTCVGSYSLTSADGFRRGVAAYRNLRDWAAEQRHRAVEEARERLAPDSSAE